MKNGIERVKISLIPGISVDMPSSSVFTFKLNPDVEPKDLASYFENMARVIPTAVYDVNGPDFYLASDMVSRVIAGNRRVSYSSDDRPVVGKLDNKVVFPIHPVTEWGAKEKAGSSVVLSERIHYAGTSFDSRAGRVHVFLEPVSREPMACQVGWCGYGNPKDVAPSSSQFELRLPEKVVRSVQLIKPKLSWDYRDATEKHEDGEE